MCLGAYVVGKLAVLHCACSAVPIFLHHEPLSGGLEGPIQKMQALLWELDATNTAREYQRAYNREPSASNSTDPYACVGVFRKFKVIAAHLRSTTHALANITCFIDECRIGPTTFRKKSRGLSSKRYALTGILMNSFKWTGIWINPPPQLLLLIWGLILSPSCLTMSMIFYVWYLLGTTSSAIPLEG